MRGERDTGHDGKGAERKGQYKSGQGRTRQVKAGNARPADGTSESADRAAGAASADTHLRKTLNFWKVFHIAFYYKQQGCNGLRFIL